jgi:hypothetical protein
MRYKKVQRVAFQGNSPRNIILRQQFAKVMISELESSTRVINCDETWLNMMDFRHRKYRRKGDTNVVATRSLNPRISVITSIDTNGNCYVSM